MGQLIERCAGLDVHKAPVTACVRLPGGGGTRQQHTRTFRTTTAGLVLLRDWLASHQATVVAMESTGVCRKPCYWLLEDDFARWRLNARHLRNVPGRVTPSMSSCGGIGCHLGEPLGGSALLHYAEARHGEAVIAVWLRSPWRGRRTRRLTAGSSAPQWPARSVPTNAMRRGARLLCN